MRCFALLLFVVWIFGYFINFVCVDTNNVTRCKVANEITITIIITEYEVVDIIVLKIHISL